MASDLVSSFSCANKAGASGFLTLAKKGSAPAYTIVLPKAPSKAETFAAAELRIDTTARDGLQHCIAFREYSVAHDPKDLDLEWVEGTLPVSPTETVTVRWHCGEKLTVAWGRVAE